jgi:hypothetical protein
MQTTEAPMIVSGPQSQSAKDVFRKLMKKISLKNQQLFFWILKLLKDTRETVTRQFAPTFCVVLTTWMHLHSGYHSF